MGVASEYVVPTLEMNVTNQSRTFQDNLRTVFPDPAKKFAWRDVPKILHVQLRKIQVLVHAMGMARLASRKTSVFMDGKKWRRMSCVTNIMG